jgi:6-oxo-cyclohex-1-ene-carbonyl-CoA hydrolase
MTEARAGFRAFNEGTRETGREIDFVALRRALAANERWSDELTEDLMPGAAQRKMMISAMPWSDHKAAG